jgi:hypothetical protein
VAKAHILSRKGAVRLQASPSYRHLTVTYNDSSFQVSPFPGALSLRFVLFRSDPNCARAPCVCRAVGAGYDVVAVRV